MAAPCRPKMAPDAPTDGPGLISMLSTLPARPLITNRKRNWTRPKACSHIMPSTSSAIALPTRCSTLPCRTIALTRRHHSPETTPARVSAPARITPAAEPSAPVAASAANTTTRAARMPRVAGGRRRMRRSKSRRRPSSMSGVIRSARSGASTSAALAGVEHDAGRERDPAVEHALGIFPEIEHVAVEQRELAIELADRFARGALEHEVGTEQAEERPEHAAQQRQHDRLLHRQRDHGAAGARDAPALAQEVVNVVLAQACEHRAVAGRHRVRPHEDRHALVLQDAQHDLAPRVVAIDRDVAERTRRHRHHDEHGERESEPEDREHRVHRVEGHRARREAEHHARRDDGQDVGEHGAHQVRGTLDVEDGHAVLTAHLVLRGDGEHALAQQEDVAIEGGIGARHRRIREIGAASRAQLTAARRAFEEHSGVLGPELVDLAAPTRGYHGIGGLRSPPEPPRGLAHVVLASRACVRRTADGGRRYTARNTALNRRMLANPAANAMAEIGIVVSSSIILARCTRRVAATELGDAPACRRNRRRRCRGPTPSVSASASTDFSSRKPRSISLSARETVAAAPRHAGVPGAVSGRQRKHGRNPARSAAAAVGKNTTFRDRAGRTGHVGRQYTPVVLTPVKNRPSKRGSRAIRARSHVLHSRTNDSAITEVERSTRRIDGRRARRRRPKTARQHAARPVRSRADMTRYFYGWNVVAATFVVALFAFGLGFYGVTVYLATLQRVHPWAASAVSAPVTVYYVAGALLSAWIGDVYQRFGPRVVITMGSLAMALGVATLGVVTQPWHLYPVFLVMAVGWGAMSGAALNLLVAPWFERRRGLAVSIAFNGATLGGVVIAPMLVPLIDTVGFTWAVATAAVVSLVVLLPLAAFVMRPGPEALGLGPDGDAPVPARRAATAEPGRRSAELRTWRFWSISAPFALGLAAQVGVLTHQVSLLAPVVGSNGARSEERRVGKE